MFYKLLSIALLFLGNQFFLFPADNINTDIKIYPQAKTEVIEKPSLKSDKQAVLDVNSDVFIYKDKSQEAQPIASITKLMTALVFLENNPGWEEVYTIGEEDRRDGGRVYLYLGEKVKVKDLFNMSLVASANTGTISLVNSTSLSEEEFVKLMNKKARSLGLFNTHFQDPVGLSPENVSNAQEVAILAKKALSKDKIREAVSQSEYSFTTQGGRLKNVESTDRLLDYSFKDKDFKILGGKTGYIKEAGFCFVGEFNKEGDDPIISVVLNSDTVNNRFKDSYNLVSWIYENYY